MTNILYHYCSIDTLELILKNKTFRFSSLGVVDDMEESMTSDFDDIGRICFTSCWTDLEHESVEMWRSYAGGKGSVRIGLPKDIFNTDKSDDEEIELSDNITEIYDVQISPPYIPQLIPVTYTKDEYLINLPVSKDTIFKCNKCNNTAKEFDLATDLLGRFKREYWAGQSEWRYKMIAVPGEYYRNNLGGKYLKGEPKDRLELMKSDLRTLPFKFDHIDFPVEESVFDDIKVLLGPFNTEEDNETVKQIIRTHLNLKDFECGLSELKIRMK